MAWGGQHDVYELQKAQKLSQLTIADLLESHELVWRSCIVDGIPSLLPSLRAKDYPDHVQGRLSVIVVRADGLSKPTLSTSMRPYVVLEVGNMELRSSKKKATETGGATWNEIFEFPIDFDLDEAPKDNEDYLIVNVFHKYYRLGRCLIAIKELSSIFRAGRKFILPPVSLNDAASIVSRGADGVWKSTETTSASWYPLGKNEFLTEPAGFVQLEFSFAPGVEEEPHHVRWQPDTDLVACPLCHIKFTMFLRKHHCRKCGSLVCGECSQGRMIITRNNTNARKRNESGTKAVRVCDLCEPNKSMRTAMEKERASEQLARIRKLSTWEPVDKRQLIPSASEEDDSDEKHTDSEIVARMGGSYALDLDSNREAYICECGRVCTYDSETNLRDFAARMRDTGEMPPLPTGSPRERWAWVSSVMGLKDSVDFSSRISLPEPPSESPARSRPSAERYSEVTFPPPGSLPTGVPPSPRVPPPSRSPAKRKPTIVKLNFGQICVCGRVIISASRPSNNNRRSTYHHPTRSRSTVALSHPTYISPSPPASTSPLLDSANNPATTTNLSSSPSLSASHLASSLSSSASFSSPLASSLRHSSSFISPPSSSSSSSSSSCVPAAASCATSPRTPPSSSMPLSSSPSSPSATVSLNSNNSSNLHDNSVNNNKINTTENTPTDNESRQRQLEKSWQANLRSTATPSVAASAAPLMVSSTTSNRPKRTTTISPSPRSDRTPPDHPSVSSSSPASPRAEYVPDGRGSFTLASSAAPGKSPPPPPSGGSEGSKTLKPLRPARGQGDESIVEPARLRKSAYATLGAVPSSQQQQPLARYSKKQSLPPEPDGGPDRAAYARKDSEQVLPPSWNPGIKR